MNKYWKILPLLIGTVSALSVIRRELWFDEALTLLNFVLPLELGKIYFSYIIPNNQIIYSMMLKVWDWFYCGILEVTVFWRLLSLCCAVGMLAIVMMLRNKLDNGKLYPAVLVLSAMCISAGFINYATALRGYAASWLFAAGALWGLYNIFHNKTRSGWSIYITSSLLAIGTVPTNLLVLAASWIYALPWMQKDFWRDRRFYLTAAVIPASLIVFYAPIAQDFLNTFKLGEGFSSRTGAAAITLGMYVASFGLLLIFALLAIKKQPWQHCLRYLIWLMPFAAIFVLHRAPFPRVFITILPVLSMLVIDGISGLIGENWNKFHRTMFFLTIAASQIILIAGGAVIAHKSNLSQYEDDFFHPWYMFPDYQVSSTVKILKELPADKSVFISFPADPAPLLFYAATDALQRNFLSDIPYNSVKNLAPGSLLVLRSNENSADYEKRFNGKLRKLSGNRWQTVWELY